MIVVSDTPDELRLALLPGAECQIPRELAANGHAEPRDGWRWDAALSGNWELDLWRWRGTQVLMFLRPGDPYAVYLFWSHQSGNFLGWYVNFQRPFVCSAPGFDTHDLELDLVVAPDGASRGRTRTALPKA